MFLYANGQIFKRGNVSYNIFYMHGQYRFDHGTLLVAGWMSVTLLPNLYTEALRPKAMASEDESSGRSSGSDGVTRAWPHDGIGALRRRGTRELSGGSFSVCTHSEGAGGGVPSCKPGEVLNRTRPCGPWPHSQSRELWENKLLLFKPEDKLLLLLWQPEPRFFYCFSGSILWE